jgi:4-hydroxy-tetrahydrodipicolinate synthase
MPTPFTKKLELDTESASRLVEHQVRLGIKGIILASPNGEGYLMSDSMRMELVKEVVKSNEERMLLSMSIMDSSAVVMLDNIKRIADCGIDIAVIGFPFTPIDIELEYLQELYLSVLEKSPLPVSINHINKYSPTCDETELFKQLIMHPKVVQLNDCSNSPGKMDMVLTALRKRGNELSVFTGNEFSCASYAGIGYEGFLLGSACFTGFIANKILELAHAGRIKDAWEMQDHMNILLLDVFGRELEHYLVGQKQIMVELGVFSTARTIQDYPVSEEFINKIKKIVRQGKGLLLPQINHSKPRGG